MIDFIFKEDKTIFRSCPICEESLDFNDYKNTTFFNINFNLLKMWNNEKLAIPCCNCYKIMMDIITDKYSKELNNIEFNNKYKFKTIYKNLMIFGVID